MKIRLGLISNLYIFTLLISCTPTESYVSTKQLYLDEVIASEQFNATITDSISISGLSNVSNFKSTTMNGELLYAFIDLNNSVVQLYRNGVLSKFGETGRGPFEYVNPSIIQIHEENVYVWDSSQLKFVVFDLNGNGIFESEPIKHSIQNFVVVDMDTLILYTSSGFNEGLLGVYSLKSGEIDYIGNSRTSEDHILALMSPSGGLHSIDSQIYYSYPSRPDIYVLNINGSMDMHLTVSSSRFVVEPFEGDFRLKMNTDRNALIQYVFNNSAVIGLYSFKDLLVMNTINGRSMANDSRNIDYSKRYHVFYFFNSDLDYVGSLEMPFSNGMEAYNYWFEDDSMMNLKIDHESGEHKLFRYSID